MTHTPRTPLRLTRWATAPLLLTLALLAACAAKPNPPPEPGSAVANWTERQQAALVNAHLLPADSAYETHYLQWQDDSRPIATLTPAELEAHHGQPSEARAHLGDVPEHSEPSRAGSCLGPTPPPGARPKAPLLQQHAQAP